MNVTERFLKYISFDTQSDESSMTIPSTAKQKILGQALAEELAQMGLQDARMDEFGYVYAYLPANCEGVAPMGLVAHMDTSPAVTGANVKPRIVHYEGGDIQLNEKVVTTVEKFPFLNKYVGHDLIVTDGNTLLGGDDKAGIAEIMCAVEYFLEHPEEKHGKICVGFTPDEEIGRGPDKFDVSGFGADYAYTVDGGEVGGIEYENFNAASAKVSFHGLSSHTGDAKGKMINAGRIACEFASMLPADEIPERTSGREGFIHIDVIKGNVTEALVGMIIRDHDWDKFIEKKELVQNIADRLCEKYGQGTVIAEVKDTYYNMKEKVLPNMFIVDKAMNAYRKNGIEPRIMAIRGGTDGATLSYMGLPCPNIATGGMNCHGIHEMVSIQSMEKMVDIILDICRAE